MEKICFYNIYAFAALITIIPCLASNLTTDQSTLLSFKSLLTSNPHHVLTKNWTNSSSVCDWVGVACGLRHDRVTALNLSNMGLSGTIPSQLGNLSFPVSLDLSYNHFSGKLPLELSLLHRLKSISLKVNNFTGEIPPWFDHLPKLEYLSLRNNSFTGVIPKSLSNLSNLLYLDFNFNSLHGERKLPNLQDLSIEFNHLSGVIPSAIYNISTLETIAFTSNELIGTLPTNMCDNLPFLKWIGLSYNQLSGQLPSNLSRCSKLQSLSLSYNNFSGEIPASIGKSKSLEILYLGGNKLHGVIPKEIGNLQNLIKLGIEKSNISGKLPISIFNLSSLQVLILWGNNLGGSLSREIGNLTMLNKLVLVQNNFTGLLELDLSSNSLDGILPPEMGNLVALTHMDLAMNQFSKTIPTTIGKLQNLIYLSLAHNRLEGSIPESMGSMISLLTLNLSYNNLSGQIPKSLETLQLLDYFNVSFNDLSGEIPTGGPFKNFTIESFKENKALCGISRFHVPLCPVGPNHRSWRKTLQLALFILAGVISLITILSLTFIYLRYRWNNKATSKIDELVHYTVPERISYYEILQSTEQFSERNLLGIGGFGSVYRGVLRNGKVIAVKVFTLQTEAAFRSFDVECNVLRSIRHRNLTKVISSCSNGDFRALVLEYMPMGNLEKWLHSHNHCLDAMQRINIMIDVACALEYLHHGYSTSIVHCDLKPSNVLLDEEMVAHVSDFGISKVLGEGENIVLTNTLATMGYIAPEYGLEGLVSTRCDVYSFGIMLMETFTRKRPSDDMFRGDLSLKSWVESLLPHSMDQVIDINLLMNLDDEHYDKMMHCAFSILTLALKCSAESPIDRINMKITLLELQKVKHQFF